MPCTPSVCVVPSFLPPGASAKSLMSSFWQPLSRADRDGGGKYLVCPLKTASWVKAKGKESSGHHCPASCAALPLSICRQISQFQQEKKTCFDSSGMRSALRCPFPVVCTGAWLLGLVAANFVSLTGRKQGGLSPVAQGGRGAGCADVAGCGAAVAPQAAVVFLLPLCKGTAGFSMSRGQGAAPSCFERCGLKA